MLARVREWFRLSHHRTHLHLARQNGRTQRRRCRDHGATEALESRCLLAAVYEVDFTLLEVSDYSQAEVLVRFNDDVNVRKLNQIDAVGPGYRDKYLTAPLGENSGSDWQLHKLPVREGESVEGLISYYNSLEIVDYAEPNFYVFATAAPDDTSYPQMWGMHGPKGIGAECAWDTRTDSSSVTVAVIDSGVDYNHSDLNSNVWTNPGETPGNGLDDDGNGYPDDVYGWDFFQADGEPMDVNGHGTHVAGTIGAQGNNATGVTGVGWDASLMSLRVLGGNGRGSTWDIAQAIDYAVDNGAKVINASLGWTGAGHQGVSDAIDRAKDQGVLFVAAAGNSQPNENPPIPASDLDGSFNAWPAEYSKVHDNVITVAAINPDGTLGSYSHWGDESVQIAAPGTDIYSTLLGGGYGGPGWSGTSMATPHVAGAAALLWAEQPGMSYLGIKHVILNSTRPELMDVVAHGVLDLCSAMKALSTEVAVRDYGSNQGYVDPQSGAQFYDEFWVGGYNKQTDDVDWESYEEGIPIGADFAQTGDFDGDGYDDVLSTWAGQFTVALNLGTDSDFGVPTNWGAIQTATPLASSTISYLIADFNADGMDDVAWVQGDSGNNRFWVAESTGTSFVKSEWGGDFHQLTDTYRASDFDGDGDQDIIASSWNAAEQEFYFTVWFSNAVNFGGTPSDSFTPATYDQPTDVLPEYWYGWGDLRYGNFDGDAGNGDEVAMRYLTGHGTDPVLARENRSDWWVWDPAASTHTRWYEGGSAGFNEWVESVPLDPISYDEQSYQNIRVGDFNGDGADDLFGRNKDGELHVLLSDFDFPGPATSFRHEEWGIFTKGVDQTPWPMDPGQPDNGYTLTAPVGVFVGDFTANGRDDILWITKDAGEGSGSGGSNGSGYGGGYGGSGSGGSGSGSGGMSGYWDVSLSHSLSTGGTDLFDTREKSDLSVGLVFMNGEHKQNGNSGQGEF